MQYIDNFDRIIPLLNWKSDDEFYFVQILRRKKENAGMKGNARVVRTYKITNEDQLLELKEDIISLCKESNARAYISLNVKSFKKVSFNALKILAERIACEQFKAASSAYDSAIGQTKTDRDKSWIVDFDSKDDDEYIELVSAIKQCKSKTGEETVRAVIPTKNGYHLICNPFNLMEFKNAYTKPIDIHKDNPTLLYCMWDNEEKVVRNPTAL